MKRERKYPVMPFDTGDWLKCPELRAVPPDVRGLWMDMLCYMWESAEQGVMVAPNGRPYSQEEIVRIIGLDSHGSDGWLQVLIDSGVCGVRYSDGAIYSRRMVRDSDLREKRAAAGRKGGQTARAKEKDRKAENPALEAQTEAVPGQTREVLTEAPSVQQEEPETLTLFPVPAEAPKPKKAKKEEEPKIEFAENVFLTQREYDKLVIDFGKTGADWMVNKLYMTKGSNGNKYKSDYLAIRNWVVDAYEEAKQSGKIKQYRDAGSGSQTAGGFGTGSTL